MLLAAVEDLTGSIPLVIFPKAYEKCAPLLTDDEVVIIKGKLNRDFRTDELNVMVETVEPLEELEKVRSLHIELVDLTDGSLLSRMKETLTIFRGNDPVFIRMDGRSVELGKNNWVDINPDLIQQLEEVLGSGAVNVKYAVVKKKMEEADLNV